MDRKDSPERCPSLSPPKTESENRKPTCLPKVGNTRGMEASVEECQVGFGK